MNDARDISRFQTSAPEALSRTGAFRALLAAMYHVIMALLGRPMSRAEREAHREQALRLRKTGIATGRARHLLDKGEARISDWSGDHRRHWRTRLLALSVDPDAPDIIFRSRNLVCRLRNAQAAGLRPECHSHSYLVLAVMSRLGHEFCQFIFPGLSVLLSTNLQAKTVRAPP